MGSTQKKNKKDQLFVLDITLYADLKRPGRTDHLEDTINYSKATKCVAKVMEEGPYDLIERVAARVAQQLLEEFSLVEQVTVLLKNRKHQ